MMIDLFGTLTVCGIIFLFAFIVAACGIILLLFMNGFIDCCLPEIVLKNSPSLKQFVFGTRIDNPHWYLDPVSKWKEFIFFEIFSNVGVHLLYFTYMEIFTSPNIWRFITGEGFWNASLRLCFFFGLLTYPCTSGVSNVRMYEKKFKRLHLVISIILDIIYFRLCIR